MTMLALARALGPEDFGLYTALFALAVLVGAFATFGTHLTLLRDLARDPASRDTNLPRSLGTTALVGTGLFLVFLLLCRSWLAIRPEFLVMAACIGLAETVVQPFLLLSATERHAQGLVARAQLLMIGPQIMRAVVATYIWLVPVEAALAVYVAGHLVSVVVALGVALFTASVPWPRVSKWGLLKRTEWRENAGYALMGLTGAGSSELDKALALSLLPPSVVGLYSAASRVVGAVVMPVVALALAALPRLFREASLQNGALFSMLFVAAMAYGFVAGGVIWLGAPLVQLLFGLEYAEMAPYIRCLAFAVPAISLRIAGMNVMMTRGRTWSRMAIEICGLVILMVLANGMREGYGSYALPLAVATMEWFMAILCWGLIWGRARTKGNDGIQGY